MNSWNVEDLKAPPVKTYKVDSSEIDINAFASVLREGLNIFKKEECLKAEHEMLARYIYKMKSKYKSNEGFKAMNKVNQCILQYLQTNFRSTLQQFYELFPTNENSDVYLPTRNNLQYLLVLLQGIVGLFSCIVETTRIALNLLEECLRVVNGWRRLLFCISCLSRIWALSKNMVKLGCDLYEKLFPYEGLLKNIEEDWLPQFYELPGNLKDWVNSMWIVDDDEKLMTFEKQCPPIFVIPDDDVTSCESSLKQLDDGEINLNIDDDSVVNLEEAMDSDDVEVVGQYSGKPHVPMFDIHDNDVIICESSVDEKLIIVDDDASVVIFEEAKDDDHLEDVVQSSGKPAEEVAQNLQTAKILPVIELTNSNVGELVQHPEIINVESDKCTGESFERPVETQPQKANYVWRNRQQRRANNQWSNWQPQSANNQWSNWQPGRANNQFWNWQPRTTNTRWINWKPQRANTQRSKSSVTKPSYQNLISVSQQNINSTHASDRGSETKRANFEEVGNQFQVACVAARLAEQAALAKNADKKTQQQKMQISEVPKETINKVEVKQENFISMIKKEPPDVVIKIEPVGTE